MARACGGAAGDCALAQHFWSAAHVKCRSLSNRSVVGRSGVAWLASAQRGCCPHLPSSSNASVGGSPLRAWAPLNKSSSARHTGKPRLYTRAASAALAAMQQMVRSTACAMDALRCSNRWTNAAIQKIALFHSTMARCNALVLVFPNTRHTRHRVRMQRSLPDRQRCSTELASPQLGSSVRQPQGSPPAQLASQWAAPSIHPASRRSQHVPAEAHARTR
jgi:hypothetical protein